MRKLLHRLAHLLKINKGRPDAFWKGDTLMMSFLCECGERSGIHEVEDMFERLVKELNKRKEVK